MMATRRGAYSDSPAWRRGVAAAFNNTRVPNPYQWPTDDFQAYDRGFYTGSNMTNDNSVLPYQNGLLAAEQGKDRTRDNPYPLATTNSADWLEGFDSYKKPEVPAP